MNDHYEEIVTAILSDPEYFNMAVYFTRDKDANYYCICGLDTVLNDPYAEDDIERKGFLNINSERSANRLGLDVNAFLEQYYGGFWDSEAIEDFLFDIWDEYKVEENNE